MEIIILIRKIIGEIFIRRLEFEILYDKQCLEATLHLLDSVSLFNGGTTFVDYLILVEE